MYRSGLYFRHVESRLTEAIFTVIVGVDDLII